MLRNPPLTHQRDRVDRPQVQNPTCRVCGQPHDLAFQETNHPDYAPGVWLLTCTNLGCPLGHVGYTFDDLEYSAADLSTQVWYAVNYGTQIKAGRHAK